MNATSQTHKSLTVALAQLDGGDSMADNISLMQQSAATATMTVPRPDLLVFPECFLTGYYVDNPQQRAVQPATALSTLQTIAIDNNIALIGGYIEQESESLRNAAMFIDNRGAMQACYHKRCLYGDWEKNTFTAGKAPCVVEWRGWRIGVCICYDIEFPEITRQLALAGADVIIAPTALMAPDEELAFTLLPARAIENGVFVGYANRIGSERELRYVGGSRILDSSGNALAQASADKPAIIQATLTKPANAEKSTYLQDVAQIGQQS